MLPSAFQLPHHPELYHLDQPVKRSVQQFYAHHCQKERKNPIVKLFQNGPTRKHDLHEKEIAIEKHKSLTQKEKLSNKHYTNFFHKLFIKISNFLINVKSIAIENNNLAPFI